MMQEETALVLLERRANLGDIAALFYLSVMYEDGRGVERDLPKAAHWCTKAAEAGDRQSQYRLSKMLEAGKGFEKRSDRAAWFWLAKAARAGHTQAKFELGFRCLFGVFGVHKSLYKAKRWLASAAGSDHADANYYLGFMYLHGLGFVENAECAFKYFSRAGALNNLAAQCSLAFMYEHGVGCEKNVQMSKRLYEQSAHGGHVGAQFGLACLLLSLKQYKDALVWCNVAANNGVVPAQAILAKLYLHGLGMQRDLVKALMWCLIVQNDDDADPESTELARLCHHNVTSLAHSHELDAAHKQACEWLNRKKQLPQLVENDWNEHIKRGIVLYEKNRKRWT